MLLSLGLEMLTGCLASIPLHPHPSALLIATLRPYRGRLG